MTLPPASREELLAFVGKVLKHGLYTASIEAEALLAREVPPRCGAFFLHPEEGWHAEGVQCDLPKGHTSKHRVEWGGT